MLGRDLLVWAENPGAPVRLFVLPGAALAVSGRHAWLCGAADDWEELSSFLRFVGVERLRSSSAAPWRAEMPIYCYGLRPGRCLPLAEKPEERPDPAPPAGEVADFLFGEDRTRRDDFYAEICPALSRGMARLWALRDVDGGILTTVGAYALYDGEAYLAMGQTLPERRGQGMGGRLIARTANLLAAEGWQVSFLCKPARCSLYERLGFEQLKIYNQYKIE